MLVVVIDAALGFAGAAGGEPATAAVEAIRIKAPKKNHPCRPKVFMQMLGAELLMMLSLVCRLGFTESSARLFSVDAS
jgi:hypothetical protein